MSGVEVGRVEDFSRGFLDPDHLGDLHRQVPGILPRLSAHDHGDACGVIPELAITRDLNPRDRGRARKFPLRNHDLKGMPHNEGKVVFQGFPLERVRAT